jgi:hypothetical protein
MSAPTPEFWMTFQRDWMCDLCFKIALVISMPFYFLSFCILDMHKMVCSNISSLITGSSIHQ